MFAFHERIHRSPCCRSAAASGRWPTALLSEELPVGAEGAAQKCVVRVRQLSGELRLGVVSREKPYLKGAEFTRPWCPLESAPRRSAHSLKRCALRHGPPSHKNKIRVLLFATCTLNADGSEYDS